MEQWESSAFCDTAIRCAWYDALMQKITYPHLPHGRSFKYVSADNPFMQAAKREAQEHSLDKTVQTGSVVVKNDTIIGRGANGSTYHQTHECERVRRNIPTGQGYELCEGCHPKNHSEPRAIHDAQKNEHETLGSDLYLWGHWWCCAPCWERMIEAGIENVYLMKDSEKLFNKEHPENIIGR